jgi:hypothetical protein
MTAVEQFGAAYLITGLSVRVSELHELDQAEEQATQK